MGTLWERRNIRKIHIRRLEESLDKIPGFLSSGSITSGGSEFGIWKRRTMDSLQEIFGENSYYAKEFSGFQFFDTGAELETVRQSVEWTQEDQKVFHKHLEQVKDVLTDAIVEARGSAGKRKTSIVRPEEKDNYFQ